MDKKFFITTTVIEIPGSLEICTAYNFNDEESNAIASGAELALKMFPKGKLRTAVASPIPIDVLKQVVDEVFYGSNTEGTEG